MRNDFPGHPAGALREAPDPTKVIELKEDSFGVWVIRICGGLMLAAGLFMLLSPLQVFKNVGAAMALLSIPFFVWAEFANDRRGKPVIRIRPDGLEFPRDGLPPIHWADVQAIDMAVLRRNFNEATAQDFLGILLHPEAKPRRNPYVSALGKAAMFVADWPFDVIYPGRDLGRAVPHVVMEMRARHEAARASPPAAPAGLEPIRPGQIDALCAARPKPRSKILLGLAGLLLLMGAASLYNGAIPLLTGAPPKILSNGSPGIPYSRLVVQGIAFLVIAWGIWPRHEKA